MDHHIVFRQVIALTTMLHLAVGRVHPSEFAAVAVVKRQTIHSHRNMIGEEIRMKTSRPGLAEPRISGTEIYDLLSRQWSAIRLCPLNLIANITAGTNRCSLHPMNLTKCS